MYKPFKIDSCRCEVFKHCSQDRQLFPSHWRQCHNHPASRGGRGHRGRPTRRSRRQQSYWHLFPGRTDRQQQSCANHGKHRLSWGYDHADAAQPSPSSGNILPQAPPPGPNWLYHIISNSRFTSLPGPACHGALLSNSLAFQSV